MAANACGKLNSKGTREQVKVNHGITRKKSKVRQGSCESHSVNAACRPWRSFQAQLVTELDWAYQLCVLRIFIGIMVQFIYLFLIAIIV